MSPLRVIAILLLTPLPFSGGAHAATITAGDPGELTAALATSQPGDVILLRSGTWRDARIDVSRGGADGKPITLRAEVPGKTILAGASTITLSAPHVVVEGLLFRDGAIEKGQVIRFASDHGRVSDCAIVDYNPADVATGYYWVFFDGNHNRLERCLFSGKSNDQPLIGNAIRDSRHNVVSRCHFLDVPYLRGRNGREIFRIWGYGGNEELGEDGAFFTIEQNLFERAHGEGMEIISLKSNRNVVRQNTIRGTRGEITNRSGNFNRIEGNLIFGDGQEGAQGIRIVGQNHRVLDNYVEGCAYGINLYAGEHFESDLTGKFQPILRETAPLGRVPRYGHVRNGLIARNVLVHNTGPDLVVGGNYKSGWPGAQRVLLPEGMRVEENLIVRSDGGAAVTGATVDRNPPLDPFRFEPNRYSGNVVSGGVIKLAEARSGFTERQVNLAGIDGGSGARSNEGTMSAGGVGIKLRAAKAVPLTAGDVGPRWRK